jgi:hypothetical protein
LVGEVVAVRDTDAGDRTARTIALIATIRRRMAIEWNYDISAISSQSPTREV